MLFAAYAAAKNDRGCIGGTVTDASGAVIPGAAAGDYPAAATGFQKLGNRRIGICTGEKLPFDMQVEIGSIADAVAVKAEVPLVERASADTARIAEMAFRTSSKMCTQTPALRKQHVPVLLVSSHQPDRDSLSQILSRPQWKLLGSSRYREALLFLRQSRVPLVICNGELPDCNWRLLLDSLADLPDPPKLIVSSRLADERLWAEVLNLGGYDVLPTPFDAGEVLRVALQAAECWERQYCPPAANRYPSQTEVHDETDPNHNAVCCHGR
jgi:CheY-like chemotaxis protein